MADDTLAPLLSGASMAVELRDLRKEMKRMKEREKYLVDQIRFLTGIGLDIPDVTVTKSSAQARWIENALPTARLISADLVQETLVPIKSVEAPLFEQCCKAELITYEYSTPRVLVKEPKTNEVSK